MTDICLQARDVIPSLELGMPFVPVDVDIKEEPENIDCNDDAYSASSLKDEIEQSMDSSTKQEPKDTQNFGSVQSKQSKSDSDHEQSKAKPKILKFKQFDQDAEVQCYSCCALMSIKQIGT